MPERLLVELGDDGRVRVMDWPAGEQYPRAVGEPVGVEWPLADEELGELRWYLEEYLRLPTAVYGERGGRVAARLPEWGERVFGAVFGAGAARDAYVAARARAAAGGGGVEVALLSASARQLGLPWELMVAPGRDVPLALEGVAVSRGLLGKGMRDVFEVPGEGLRVLMVISRPRGTADVGYRMIARPLLRRLEAVRGAVELVVLRPPTLERLREALTEAREAGKPFHVVHFDGHGVFGQEGEGSWGPRTYESPGPRGMLAFEQPGGGTHLVTADEVARVLAAARVPVVVLNACQSAQLETGAGARVEAAVATRLLAEGCASVVAMAYSVYAVAAAEFMTAFYERLFAGDRVADAVAAGRAQLALNNRRPSMKGPLPLHDWMVPVLYARSDVRFPGLRTIRTPEAAVGAVLARLREGTDGGGDQELVAEGEFVGRDAAFYTLEVAARLRRVVVLHGSGGTGKTELAKAFGRWWRDTGGAGRAEWVIWHSFEPGVASFGLDGVVNSVGRRLFAGQEEEFARLDPAKRQAAVEHVLANQRVLLLWDNFESVREMPDPGRATPPLSPAEQEGIRAFVDRVARGGRSAVVITSRTPESWLGPAPQRVELGGLDAEEAASYADHLLAGLPGAAERRASPAFAELMRWLDGHPLSMRLTLRHLGRVGARQLLDGLKGTAALPGEEAGEGGGRHGSLAACVAYSFAHLGEGDQQALTVLSLVHGVADAAVLEVFSDSSRAPERFRGLTGQGWSALLRRASDLGLLTPLGDGMFRLHPALPAHLAERWRALAPHTHAEERAMAIGVLISAYAVLGIWLDGQVTGGNAQRGLFLMDSQRNMLGAMLSHALDQGRWRDAQDIIQPLDYYWNTRGLTQEALSWTDRVRLAVEGPGGEPPEMATPAGDLWLFAADSQADREVLGGRLDRAEGLYRAVLDSLWRRPDRASRHHVASCLHQLGAVARNRGRLAEAEDWYRRSLALSEELGNQPGVASCFYQLGLVAHDRGRPAEAEGWYSRSLAITHRLGNRLGMASAFHQLGLATQQQGRLAEALDWYRQSLAIKQDLGNRSGVSATYHQLGLMMQEVGNPAKAEEWYRQSLAIKEDLGDLPGMAVTYHQLGLVALQRQQLTVAEDWLRRSLAISEDLNNRPGMALTYALMGLIAGERRDPAQALIWMVRAAALFEEFPHPAAGPAPRELRRLTAHLGLAALERAWLDVTGAHLPPQVRAFVLAAPNPQGDNPA